MSLPTPPDRPTPAVLYGAKSTADKRDSIPEQLDDCRAMAEENGWFVVAEFSDEGFSAFSGNRGPDLARATAAARAAAAEYGTPAMLVAQAHDRFARGAGDRPGAAQSLGEIWHEMRRANVWLRTAEDDEELRDESSVAAIGRRAHLDSLRKSKATRKGVARAAKRGKPWGSNPAYGYKRRDDGHWTPDPAERPTYQRIFRERVEHGRSRSAIGKRLEADDIPTRTPGANWTSGLVGKILAGRYGLGEFSHKGEWIKGEHEPLISVELWEAAQAMAAMGGKFAPSKGGRRPSSHLFTNGILRCHLCFQAMLPRSDPDRYCCRTNVQIKGAGSCAMPSHRREDVDRLGLEMFERSFLDLDSTREHVAGDLRARAAEIDALRARAVAEEVAAAESVARVRRDYTSGKIDAADWRELRSDLEGEHRAAVAERDRLAASAQAVREGRAELDADGAVLRRLADLRVAVIERKRTAEQGDDIDALRGALAQTFTEFVLSEDGQIIGGFATDVAGVRRQADPSGAGTPVFNSTALPLPARETNQHGTFVWKYITQNTRRPL